MLRPGNTIGVAVAGLIPAALAVVAPARADGTDLEPASWADSTTNNVMIVGGTFLPNPATTLLPGYIPINESLYLDQLGFNPTDATVDILNSSHDGGFLSSSELATLADPSNVDITSLITPESPWFGTSIAKGVNDLVNAVETEYLAGDISASNPLLIATYSQSTVIASLAEPKLEAFGIPSNDLEFFMLGDATGDPGLDLTSGSIPDSLGADNGATGILDTFGASAFGEEVFKLLGWSNLDDVTTPVGDYPTVVFTIPGDFWADWSAGEWIQGFFSHGDYPGLSESTIQAATDAPVVDSAVNPLSDLPVDTTYYTFDQPTDLGVIESFIATNLNDVGLGPLLATVFNDLGLTTLASLF